MTSLLHVVPPQHPSEPLSREAHNLERPLNSAGCSQVLQPSTNHLVADGELGRSAATSASTEPTAPRQVSDDRALYPTKTIIAENVIGLASNSERRSESSQPHVVGGHQKTPLAKAIEARGYQCAYFVVRDLAATKAHLLSMEGWQKLMRVRDYLGWRYNTITLGGTEFDPGAWRSR